MSLELSESPDVRGESLTGTKELAVRVQSCAAACGITQDEEAPSVRHIELWSNSQTRMVRG
ncbi:hypothetical protein GCM10010400_04890 [Streptomyces aculeolatus]